MSSLPEHWIEKIFERMSLTYGSRFTSMWAAVDADKLKAHWARELGGFADVPEVIGHALDHMPDDRPPTLPEFRKLCCNAPRKPLPLLPAPKADPERVSALVASLKAKLAGVKLA
jgi:hypothetical protein